MFFERNLGITSAWNDTLHGENPVRSDVVIQYTILTPEEQKKEGSIVKQSPVPVDRRVEEIITPTHTRLHFIPNTTEKLILARETALHLVAYYAKKQGDELRRALI